MVGAVALSSVIPGETALSLYRKNVFLDLPYSPAPEIPLIPEIIEDRELPADTESGGYDRFGRLNRAQAKGIFVDSYH